VSGALGRRSPGLASTFVALASTFVALGVACAPPSEPPRSVAAVGSGAAGDELGTGFRSVEATGQGLELELPDAGGWRHDTHDTRSFVALHAATRARLMVRAWIAEAMARPDDCEQQLRRLRPELPALAPEERVEERALRVAGGHAARLMAGVVPSPGSPSALDGHALLFASEGRRCLALIYSTSAQGPAAPRIIGGRLATITRVTFERVRRLGIDERVRVPRL
jgi:hypothetical protein